jgi:Co/Zn/Cd efflux system component
MNVLSLYGLYIFWTGAEKILNPPQHKKGFLMVSVFIVVAEIFIALSLAFSSVIDRIYFSFFA